MSTRCNINVETKQGTICLYHHCDGYPDGVGFDLARMFESVSKNKYARNDDFLNELLKGKEAGYKDRMNGYEFSTCGLHGDIEYLYTVNFEKRTIKCQAVSGWDEEQTFGEPFDVIEMYNNYKAGAEK